LGRFVLRRLSLLVPTLIGMSVVIFLMVRLIPGDVADTLLHGESGADPAARAALRHALGLDHPLPVQYFNWVGGMFHGDFGHSLVTGRAVGGTLFSALGITLELTLIAIVVATVIAIPLGVFAARRANKASDLAVRTLTLFGLAIPDFWLATLGLLFTSVVFHWTPSVLWVPFFDDPLRNLSQIWMPATIMTLYLIATTTRMTRTTMLDVLSQDYVRTARAKGLDDRRVIYRHALRNALIPVMTLSGVQVAALLSGVTILETMFGLPGVGYTLTQATYKRDYPLIQDAALMLAVMVVLLNLVVDVLYAVVDPRINRR
jgi:peptide/nickel transport system permease protein